LNLSFEILFSCHFLMFLLFFFFVLTPTKSSALLSLQLFGTPPDDFGANLGWPTCGHRDRELRPFGLWLPAGD
jgi:hypothetical protein